MLLKKMGKSKFWADLFSNPNMRCFSAYFTQKSVIPDALMMWDVRGNLIAPWMKVEGNRHNNYIYI